MISEEQARALLEYCEQQVGRPLEQLRARLLAHEDALGTLWELIVLHTASLIADVDHEPGEAVPDVLVKSRASSSRWLDRLLDRFNRYRNSLWLEATHVRWAPGEAADKVNAFINWIRNDLRQAGASPGSHDLRVLDPDDKTEIDIPRKEGWALLGRDPEWQAFRRKAVSEPSTQLEIVKPGGMSCRVVLSPKPPGRHRAVSSFTAPRVIRSISDHPIYKAIKNKARQAKEWNTRRRPVVLCIGSTLSTGLFGAQHSLEVSTEAAVLAALYDTSKWHPIHQHNVLRDTSGRRYRPSGVSRVAAVIVVSVEYRHEIFRRTNTRRAVSRIYVNEGARVPLRPAEIQLLHELDFNSIPYGPQSENWPAQGRRTRAIQNRRREVGKNMVYRPTPDGGFEVELPAEDLSRLLSGQIDIQTLLHSYAVRELELALSKAPPILGARFVEGDSMRRIAPRVCLQFGRGVERLIR